MAEQSVQQARALLALAPDYQHPEQIPADLERTDSQVRRAVAAGQQVLANLGLAAGMHSIEPEALHAALIRLTGNTSESWFDAVPAVRSAQTQVDQTIAMLGGPSFDPARPYEHPSVIRARKNLDEAELRLSYTEIRAPVSGFVNRRSVNPGDYVQAGQGLLSIQPLDNVYIEANFKETQLAELCDRPVGGDLGRRLSRPGRPAAGSPGSPRRPVPPRRCCRQRTPRATSSRSCSESRCGSTWSSPTRARPRSWSGCRSNPKSTSRPGRPARTPAAGSAAARPGRSSRQEAHP